MARRFLLVAVLAVLAACGQDGGGPATTSATDGAGPAADTTTVPPTSVPPPTTTTVPPRAAAHVFPLSPPGVGDYSDGHHDYPANDIFCPVGTAVVAVTDGVVDYVSPVDTWDPAVDDPATRGGISVAVVGTDGVRYYGSHLSALAPGIEAGVRVRAGELLGASGASGNAVGTDPHLHFGISRPTTPDDWMVRRGEVNPFPYLEAWRRGENLTPVLR